MKSMIYHITSNDILFCYEITKKHLVECEKLSVSAKNSVIHYLESGIYCHYSYLENKCIFDNQLVDHPNSFRTDGEFVWSADLNHYVLYHSLQLPSVFLKHIEIAKDVKILDESLDDLVNKYLYSFIEISEGFSLVKGNLLDYKIMGW